MKYGRYGWSYLFLHLGLGLTFLWIGIDMLRHPETWIDYLPRNLPAGLTRAVGLQAAAVFDTALGIVLVVQVFPKATALLATAHLLGIIMVHGVDAVLVRDIGLLGAALALLLWPRHYRKRGGWKLWPFSRRRHEEEG